MKKVFLFITTFITLFFVVNAFALSPEIIQEAKTLVNSAISYCEIHGKNDTLKEISNPYGVFVKNKLYVFVYDTKGTILADPDIKNVGKNVYNTPDVTGKLFRKELIDMVNLAGQAWVEYTYPNPANKKQTKKMTYGKKHNDMIFCCGFYER